MINYDANSWQMVAEQPGQIWVDNAKLGLGFRTVYKNINGSATEVNVGQQRMETAQTVRCFGNVEAARLINGGSGAVAKKWASRFQTPDVVVRLGQMIIYADAADYEKALEIALGIRKSHSWILQDLTWVSHDGDETYRKLVFLNLTNFRKVPPAKWFLHRPEEFRFNRKQLNPADIAVGYTHVCDRTLNGVTYPVWGKLERYGGANSFVVTEQTLLKDTVKEWLAAASWQSDAAIGNNILYRGYGDSAEIVLLDEEMTPRQKKLWRMQTIKVCNALSCAFA